MGKRKNQAGYISDAEMREGSSAFYYSEKPGTAANLMPTWATVSHRPGMNNDYVVALYVYDQCRVTLDAKGEAFARKIARTHAKVSGDGQHFCWGIDRERRCNPGTKLATKQEIERGWCDTCDKMMQETES